jgi:hypothetical protein
MNKLAIYEGVQTQRQGESVRYKVTTTPWGSNPSSVTVTVYDVISTSIENDVTLATITGSPVINGDEIILPNLHSLVKGHTYLMDVSFMTDGSRLVIPIEVKAIR